MYINSIITLLEQVKKRNLYTSLQFHYTFNICELSRAFQDICGIARKPELNVLKNSLNLKNKVRQELYIIFSERHEYEYKFKDNH